MTDAFFPIVLGSFIGGASGIIAVVITAEIYDRFRRWRDRD